MARISFGDYHKAGRPWGWTLVTTGVLLLLVVQLFGQNATTSKQDRAVMVLCLGVLGRRIATAEDGKIGFSLVERELDHPTPTMLWFDLAALDAGGNPNEIAQGRCGTLLAFLGALAPEALPGA
jgi:hypothetical protein